MIAELGVKGKIFLFEKGIMKSKITKKVYKKEDMTSFVNASSASMQNMNDLINKLVAKP